MLGKFIGCLLILFSGSIGVVHAMTVTEQEIVSFSTSATGTVPGGFGAVSGSFDNSQSFSFNFFDPALGDLNSVDILIDGVASLSVFAGMLDETLELPETIFDTFGVVTASDLGIGFGFPGFAPADTFLSFPDQSDSCFDERVFTQGRALCIAAIIESLPFSASLSSSDLSVLPNFIGTGTGSVEFEQSGFWTAVVTDGRFSASNFTSFDTSGSFEVVYTYSPVSPVPIPAAFWLFGTALVGFIGISRRRKVT